MTGALAAVEERWQHVLGLALAGSPCVVHGLAPLPLAVPVERWRDAADDSDRAVLDHCEGDVLDLGCGPGRMARELADRGHRVLGVDLLPEAIELTRARGVWALHRDVFGELPGEGAWDSVLLADGNIGIGGDPVALLRRAASLLRVGGRVVVDLEGPGVGVRRCAIRLEAGGASSEPVRWALVGVDGVDEVASAAGLAVGGALVHSGAHGRRRWFAVLRKGA